MPHIINDDEWWSKSHKRITSKDIDELMQTKYNTFYRKEKKTYRKKLMFLEEMKTSIMYFKMAHRYELHMLNYCFT
jgi:hypothetical protein